MNLQTQYMSNKDEGIDWIEVAKKALNNILELSQSQKVSEKFRSYNILLFIFSLAFNIVYYLGGFANQGLSFLLVVFIAFFISLVLSLGYAPILEILVNVTNNPIQSLRMSITILYISITLGIASFSCNLQLLSHTSLSLILLQSLTIPIIGSFVSNEKVQDIEINSKKLLTYLGHISNVVGLISFILDIALLYLGST